MNAEFYDFLMETQGTLYGAMQAAQVRLAEELEPPPVIFQIRAGLAESPGWFMVQAAEFDPDPLTVENLRVRDVYASERIAQALLELLAGEQWLDRLGKAYYLTEAGRAVLLRMRERQAKMFTTTEVPLSQAELLRLEALLRRIIEASLKRTHKPGTWCLAHSRNRAPAENEHPLLKINQYFSDFNAFRDDAHMAAWQPYKISGHTWEAFAFICDGQAISADTIYTQLAYRGYSRQEYAASLQDLTTRNWLTEIPAQPDHYQVTDTGREIRQKVEQLTDNYFYSPWSDLNEVEVAETKALLQQLRDKLQVMSH